MKKKIARNTLILLLSRFGSRLLIFLFGIYVARVLGSVNFGKIVFATSFVLTFTPLADFGIENYLLKTVSRHLKKRIAIIKNLFYPRVLLAIFAYFLALSFGFLAGYKHEDLVNISLYGLMLLPYSLNYFFLAYFNAQEKVIKSSLIKFFYPFLHVLLGLIFLHLRLSYRWLLLSVVIGNMVSAVILLILYPQVWKKRILSLVVLRKAVTKTWPFAVLIFLAVLYLRLDVLLLKRLKGDQATGFYGPANNLIETTLLIPQSFSLALFPISSRLVKKNRVKMKSIYHKGSLVLFLTSLPIALGGFLLTPILVPIFFGQEYLPSIPALKIAFSTLVFFFVNALPGNIILNSRRVKGFIPWAILNLIVNFFLNLVLINRFSFVGAAWAKLGSETFGLIINNFYVYRILHEKS